MGTGLRRMVSKVDIAVSDTAAEILADNPSRIGLILQEVGGQPVRITGEAAPLATEGTVIEANTTLLLEGSLCPSVAIWAIREGGSNGTLTRTEILQG